MVLDAAEAAARRLCEGDDREACIDCLFQSILSKEPTKDERNEFIDFVAKTEKRLIDQGDPAPTRRTWSLVCQAMFSLSRFQFLE